MTTAAICYFSQTGTTQTVADEIARGLTETGVVTTLLPMGETHPSALAPYDIIGIGLPVYVFRPPFNVLDFVRGLPELAGKAFFVFVLYGTHPGSTATIIRTLLSEKGARDLGLLYSRGADQFLGYLNQGVLFSPDSPTPHEKENGVAFGKELRTRYQSPDFTPQEDHHAASLPDLIERAACHRFLARHLYSRLFFVDKERCNGCGLCVTLCPVGNITLGKNGRPLLGRECLLCLTCELRCPKEALSSPFTSIVMSPVMKFNIWKAKRECVDHVAVNCTNGRVRRLDTSDKAESMKERV
jgi:flavodoxin/NAD-dependent dihydropyrimidine dehydrogenase PreA subunit